MRDKNTVLESLFRSFLTAPEVRLIPTTMIIWEKAAQLRAHGLKTPDAIHAATGLESGCKLFLTNDAGFLKVPNLPVVILKALLTP